MLENEKTYKVYSDLLNKPFNSVAELEAAEAEYNKAEEEKQNKLAVKKAEVEAVKTAIAARVEAEKNAYAAKAEAYKTYLETLDKIEAEVKAAKVAESKQLTEFCKEHPEGFHETIKIGDATYYYDYSDSADLFDGSFLTPFKNFWRW